MKWVAGWWNNFEVGFHAGYTSCVLVIIAGIIWFAEESMLNSSSLQKALIAPLLFVLGIWIGRRTT
jgi:hypothetical protein